MSKGARVQGRWGRGGWVGFLALVGLVTVVGCSAIPPTVEPPQPPTLSPHSGIMATPGVTSTTPPTPTSPSPTPPPHTPTTLPPTRTPLPPNSIRALLPQVAAKYIAFTEEEARGVARKLDFVGQKFEDPSNMCGPLAFAILRDAGVIDRYVDLSDVWLLNPPSDQKTLEAIFPREKFEWLSFREPTYEFDFGKEPLRAGDLLFLYAGHSGSFQHMLTVTRTDEEGRAYSVTNVNTEDGYVIQEYLLYDPQDPAAGLFNRWTNREFLMLGRTGYGGFDLWRPKSDFPTYLGDGTLSPEIDRVINFAGGEWHALVQSIPGPDDELAQSYKVHYSRLANEKVNVASVVKVPIAMLLFSTLERRGIAETEISDYIQSKGPEGRTFEQLLHAMLVKSEESATSILYHYVNQEIGIQSTLERWGIDGNVYARKFTLTDLARLFEMLYRGEILSETARDIILGYMAEYTPNDELRIGALLDEVPEEYQIYNKRGSLKDPLLVGDMAILENPHGQDYVVALFAYQGKNPATYEELEAAMGEVARVVWRWVGGDSRYWILDIGYCGGEGGLVSGYTKKARQMRWI